MKIKFLIQIVLVVVSIYYVVGDVLAVEPRNKMSKEKHRTIRVKEKEGIIPQTVTLKPGETVKWINLSLSEIEIHFQEKKVIATANHPIHFYICREGTYESHKICAGCSASLRFQEEGSFHYLVKESRTLQGGEKEFHGAMLIK
jgi:plastocyanin